MKKTAIITLVFIFCICCVTASEDQSDVEKLLKAIKTISVGVDTPDEIIQKCGNPKSPPTKNMYGIIYSYGFLADKTQIGADIIVSKLTGKTKYIRVVKYGASQEDLYTRGSLFEESSSQTNVVVAISETPTNPIAGQLYLSSTDSHFYGWNGKEWKQLDK